MLTKPPPSEGLCPGEENGDTSWKHYGDNCYWFSETYIETWAGALMQCAAKDPLATLTSVHSILDNDFIMENCADSYHNVWTGMYRTRNGITILQYYHRIMI